MEVLLIRLGRNLYPNIVMVYGCRKYDLSYVYGEGVQSSVVKEAGARLAEADKGAEESQEPDG